MINWTPLLTWMAYAFGWIGQTFLTYKSWVYTATVVTIICSIYNALTDPGGFINHVLVSFLDYVFAFWPSTPDEWKLGFLLGQFYSSIPPVLGAGLVSEVLNGIAGLMGIILIIKVYKLLPFV